MKPFILLLSVLFYSVFSCAQVTIKGKIVDERKSPLPSVVIRLKRLPDSVLINSGPTDLSGNFVLNHILEGNYLLEAGLIGYQTYIKTGLAIRQSDTVVNLGVITLIALSATLGEVTITAQAPLIERQIDKTVVNVDQNITSTGTNALELLKKLPGVQVSPDGQVTLNGKSGVNVIMDGKTTYLSADDLAALLTNMPSSDIQKIE